MAIALAIFSAMIIAISLYGVVLPLKLTGLVRRFMIGPGVWGTAAIRLLLAGLLWSVSLGRALQEDSRTRSAPSSLTNGEPSNTILGIHG